MQTQVHWALSPSLEILHTRVDNCEKAVKLLLEVGKSCIMFLGQVQSAKEALEKHLEEEEKIRKKEADKLRKKEERLALALGIGHWRIICQVMCHVNKHVIGRLTATNVTH